jgi:hypothetical protein
MAASIRASGRSRCLVSVSHLRSTFVPGCALVVAAVCASCEASTDPTEVVATSSSALAVTGLFATGVSAAGTRLAIGATDPHYVLSSNDPNFPGPNALTVNPAGGWAGAGANSRWISVEASTTGAMGGVYTYTTTFTLAGVDPATATLSGQWACDDSCVLKLNGTQVASNPTPAWLFVENFTVPAGSPFQLGANTLAFVTSNTTGGPTGLQVLSITGNVSGCDADDQCSTTQYCDTQSATCVSKLANGAPIPNVTGHTPPLTGICTAGSGAAVCTAGLCDTADNDCGLANGDGPCNGADGAAVCRSGACSVAGTCEPAGGCNADGDCTGGDWCDEATHTCTAKLANGTPIPSDPTHASPTLNGTCTTSAATLVCVSAVCDTKDNRCGLADGDGPCTVGDETTLCRTGTCNSGATCGAGTSGPDAGIDAGTGHDAGAGADAGAGEDAGAGADAGASADAGADAGTSADAGEDASEGEDARASEDASEGEDASADASEPTGQDAGSGGKTASTQGGSLQGGGLSCGVAASGSRGSSDTALWMLVITFAAAIGRGRRNR